MPLLTEEQIEKYRSIRLHEVERINGVPGYFFDNLMEKERQLTEQGYDGGVVHYILRRVHDPKDGAGIKTVATEFGLPYYQPLKVLVEYFGATTPNRSEMTAKQNRVRWNDQWFRQRAKKSIADSNAKRWRDPEYYGTHAPKLSDTMKKLWKNPKYRKKRGLKPLVKAYEFTEGFDPNDYMCGDVVSHEHFGTGEVTEVGPLERYLHQPGDCYPITVNFNGIGTKRLVVNKVRQ